MTTVPFNERKLTGPMARERIHSIDRLIDGIPLFAGLNDSARQHIVDGAAVLEFQPGSTIWQAGGMAECLHVILHGEVHIVRGSDGRQHVVHSEGCGAVVGDVPLFDGGTYPATALAFTRVSTVRIPKDSLFAAMGFDPLLSWTLLHGLASRVRILVDALSLATLRTVRSRVARHLLARACAGGDRRRIVTLGCTHAILAERLGTVRETVSREMARLRRDGVLRSAGRGGYEILNFEALERLAADVPR
jgi:CRP/FNR family transcriptional regulator